MQFFSQYNPTIFLFWSSSLEKFIKREVINRLCLKLGQKCEVNIMSVKKSKKKKSLKVLVKKVKKVSKAKKVVKKVSKKPVVKSVVNPAVKQLPKVLQPIGVVTHFFDKISVAIVKLNGTLKIGDKIKIEGHGNSFEQKISSIQREHESLQQAKKGDEVGMKVIKPAKEHDSVYLV